MRGEFGAIDDGPPADGAGTQTAGIDPPPYGVVGDAEQASGMRNPILRHSTTITAANAEDQLEALAACDPEVARHATRGYRCRCRRSTRTVSPRRSRCWRWCSRSTAEMNPPDTHCRPS